MINKTDRVTVLARRPRGFRFSATDLAAIFVCVATTWGLRSTLGDFVWLLPITLGHFFLFCNVFRIWRRYELIWAVIFVVNVCVWFAINRFSWATVLLTQAPVTLTAIACEIRSDRYHGIFCRQSEAHDLEPLEMILRACEQDD